MTLLHGTKKGRIDEFGFHLLDLGDLKKITIGHDGRGFASGWFLDKVFIKNEVSGKTWKFPANCWLEKKTREMTIASVDSKDTTFRIVVKTGDVKDAGTDANVYGLFFC